MFLEEYFMLRWATITLPMLRLRIKLTMFKVNNDGTRTSPMTPCCSVSIVNIKHVITGWAVIGVELKSQIIKRKPLTSIKLTFPYRSLIVRIKVFGILHPLFYSPFPVICFELIDCISSAINFTLKLFFCHTLLWKG